MIISKLGLTLLATGNCSKAVSKWIAGVTSEWGTKSDLLMSPGGWTVGGLQLCQCRLLSFPQPPNGFYTKKKTSGIKNSLL